MGIWSYQQYFKEKINSNFRITLEEGNTPCSNCRELAKKYKLKYLYLKREDLNPTGSFKDRSMAFQISYHLNNGSKEFVISSTGNAAISAIKYCKKAKCKLYVFVSPKIPDDKLLRLFNVANVKEIDIDAIREKKINNLKDPNFEINFVDKPKAESIRLTKDSDYVYLRGSTDDMAVIGYKTISYELSKQVPEMDAIFTPCSSGASAIGIYSGFYDIQKIPPRIYVAQTTKVSPIASSFDKKFDKTDDSLAAAISDRVALRKDQVIGIVQKSGGFGWVISDKEILDAVKDLKDFCSMKVSYDSALSLAALKKSVINGSKFKKPVLIISGV